MTTRGKGRAGAEATRAELPSGRVRADRSPVQAGRPDRLVGARRRHADTAFELGVANLRNGRLFEAHQHFSEALDACERRAECLAYLGFTTVALGGLNAEQGVEAGMAMLREADNLMMETSRPAVAPLVLMGKALRKLGDSERARTYYLRALDLAPHDPDVRREMEQLDEDERAEQEPMGPTKVPVIGGVPAPPKSRRSLQGKGPPRRVLLLGPLLLCLLAVLSATRSPAPRPQIELTDEHLEVVGLVRLERANLGWDGWVSADWVGVLDHAAATAGCEALADVLGADADETILLIAPGGRHVASCRGRD